MSSAEVTGHSDEVSDVKFCIPQTPSRANQRVSNAWLYFSQDKITNIATCLFCQKKVPHKAGSGTSNMHRHLRCQHLTEMPAEYRQKYANHADVSRMSNFEHVDVNLYNEVADLETELNQVASQSLMGTRPVLDVPTSRTRGSIVWQFFRRLSGSKKVLCTLCSRTYGCDKSSTSNMLKHLQQGHSQVYLATSGRNKQSIAKVQVQKIATHQSPKSSVATRGNDSEKNDLDMYVDDEVHLEQHIVPSKGNTQKYNLVADDADDQSNHNSDAEDRNQEVIGTASKDDLSSSESASGMEDQIAPILPRKPSAVWQHFRRLSGNQRAQCNHCSAILQSGESTSNLLKHLHRRHADVSLHKAVGRRGGSKQRSKIWKYFSAHKRTNTATCLLCNSKLAYVCNQSTGNLQRHLRSKHSDAVDDDMHDDDPTFDPVTEIGSPEPQVSVPTAPESSRVKRFQTWKYFKMNVSKKFATCLLCKKTFPHVANSSTGNLRKHLRSRHSDALSSDSEVEEHSADASVNIKTDFAISSSPAKRVPISGPLFKMLNARLLQLLKTEQVAEQPSDTCASLFQTTNSREHLRAKLTETKKRIRRTLQLADHVALTVTTARLNAPHSGTHSDSDINLEDTDYVDDDDDGPVASDRIATHPSPPRPVPIHIAVSAHCITRSDWQLHTVLLSCAQLDNWDAHLVDAHLRDLCSEWHITDKVFAFVAQKAPHEALDNCFAGLEAAMGWRRLHCVDGRLSSCIAEKMCLNEFEFVRLKVNAIVQMFKANGDALAKFQHFQREHAASSMQLIDDQVLQWRSTLRMIQRLCSLQVPLDATLDILRNENRLSTSDWMTIRDMRMQLGLLDGAIEELRARRQPSASLVCVMLRGLAAQLDALQMSEYRGETIKEFAAHLHCSVSNYAAADVEYDLLLSLCSMLDPRFRRYGFVQQAALEKCKEHVAEQVKQLVAKEANAVVTPAPDNVSVGDLWSWLDRMVSDERNDESEQTTVQHELQFYLNNTPIERCADPLLWWRNHGSVTCPILALVARKYLALPATCAVSQSALTHLERLLDTDEACSKSQVDMATANSVVFLIENLNYIQWI